MVQIKFKKHHTNELLKVLKICIKKNTNILCVSQLKFFIDFGSNSYGTYDNLYSILKI